MLVRVKVKPGSRQPRIEEDPSGGLTVYLKSAAAEGKANAELIERLAQRFGLPKSKVRIKLGATSRFKLIEIG